MLASRFPALQGFLSRLRPLLFPVHGGVLGFKANRKAPMPSVFGSPNTMSTSPIFSCVIASGDPDREAHMKAELEKVGLQDAIWLREPNRPGVPVELIAALRGKGAKMTEGEFSATLKHFLALHMFLQSSSRAGLIVEDRVEFKGDFRVRLQDYLSRLPRNFGILFEGDMVRIPGFDNHYANLGSPEFSLIKMRRGIQDWCHGATNGANCYLISRNAAESVVKNFLPFAQVIDHHLNEIIDQKKLTVYWPMPPSVHRRRIKSTVQYNLNGTKAQYLGETPFAL